MAARQNTLKDLLTTGKNIEYAPQDTPPHSDVSLSPEHSLPSSPEYSTQIKDDSDEESMGITKGLLDHTRITLCMFMFAVIAFNPFGIVLNQIAPPSDGDVGYRRNILSRMLYKFYLVMLFYRWPFSWFRTVRNFRFILNAVVHKLAHSWVLSSKNVCVRWPSYIEHFKGIPEILETQGTS